MTKTSQHLKPDTVLKNYWRDNSRFADFFNLLEILLDKSIPRNKAHQKAIQYDEEHSPDRAVIMAVAGAANSKINYHTFEKGDVNMCTLFDEIAKENEAKGKIKGKLEGKLEGRAEEIVESGFEFHLSESDILERLQRKLDVSLQKAQEYFNMYKKPAL